MTLQEIALFSGKKLQLKFFNTIAGRDKSQLCIYIYTIFTNFKSTTFHLYSKAKDGLESWKLGVVRLVALPAGCLSRQVASLQFSSIASSRPKWWNENHLDHPWLISLIITSHHFHQTYHHHINIIMTTIMMRVVLMIFQHWFWFECKFGAFIWNNFEPIQNILREISTLNISFMLNITTQDYPTSNQQTLGTAQIVFSTQAGTQQKKGLQRKFVNMLQFLTFSLVTFQRQKYIFSDESKHFGYVVKIWIHDWSWDIKVALGLNLGWMGKTWRCMKIYSSYQSDSLRVFSIFVRM